MPTLRRPGPICGIRLPDSVVIDNQMPVKILRNRLINVFQKGQKLLMPVTRPALCDDLAPRCIGRSKQGCCAMADIVVRHTFEIA